MELVQYIRLFRRWLWLILLAAFVGAGVSFIVRVNQPPVYRAQATVIVGNALQAQNPDLVEIRTGQDLALTYAQIISTFDILDAVITALDLEIAPERLDNMIDTSIVSGTSLLRISVTNTDRILASEIANELVAQLIVQSPSNLTADQQANIDLLQAEIDAQSDELALLRDELRETNEQLATENLTAEQESQLNATRTTITNQINDASANVAQNLNTIASLTQRTNSVEIVESARIPVNPIGSSIVSNVILGGLVAASLAFGGVLLYEYLNDTLRNADDLTRTLNLPVLGVITKFGKKDMSYANRLITSLPNFSKTTEEFHTLRTNILFSSPEGARTFIVSSASPEEGKSVTASNLAVSMALSGHKVLLIDGDLRRPKVHEAFQLENQIGLSNLITGRIPNAFATPMDETQPIATNKTAVEFVHKDSWKSVVKPTAIPNLSVITSGFIPNNPSELLGSTVMKRWMDEFKTSSDVDVIIFDSPPTLAVSDTNILAASLDLKVVLVVQANRTRRGVAQKAHERFENVGAEVIGAVLNGANAQDEEYYGYNYGYYYTDIGSGNGRQSQ